MGADYFARKPPTIFRDIPRVLRDVQIKCHDLGLSGEQLLQFLHDEKLRCGYVRNSLVQAVSSISQNVHATGG